MQNRPKVSFIILLYGLWSVPAFAQVQENPASVNHQQSIQEEEKKSTLRAIPKVTPVNIRRALRAYAHEPSAQQVIELVLKKASTDPEKASEMASRARNAGWIPTFRMAIRRGLGRDISEFQTIEVDKTNLSTDDDLVLEASLTFDLSRLLFSRSEVSIIREERSLRKSQMDLIRAVIHLYFKRRRLQLERDLDQLFSFEREMDIAEIEATLNAFTNGEFKSMIRVKEGEP